MSMGDMIPRVSDEGASFTSTEENNALQEEEAEAGLSAPPASFSAEQTAVARGAEEVDMQQQPTRIVALEYDKYSSTCDNNRGVEQHPHNAAPAEADDVATATLSGVSSFAGVIPITYITSILRI